MSDKIYSTSRELVEERAGDIFRALEDKSLVEVGYLFGMDKFYSTSASLRSGVLRAYQTVLDNPQKWGIEPQRAGYIQGLVSSRAISKKEPTLREQKENEEIGEIVMSARDLAAKLVRKKLRYLEDHPMALKDEKLVQLTTALAILFDKGQIIQGQATEHIAMLSNIPDKLNPEEAMRAIMAMREKIIAK